jgi:hypothetical protein
MATMGVLAAMSAFGVMPGRGEWPEMGGEQKGGFAAFRIAITRL